GTRVPDLGVADRVSSRPAEVDAAAGDEYPPVGDERGGEAEAGGEKRPRVVPARRRLGARGGEKERDGDGGASGAQGPSQPPNSTVRGCPAPRAKTRPLTRLLRRPPGAAVGAGLDVLAHGEPPLRVERGLAAGAGGGDGLPVDVVGDVAAGEHPF